MAIPADMERLNRWTQRSLNEALNVPGGTLEFDTFAMPDYGFYEWVVEGDYAKSTNAGKNGDEQIYGVTSEPGHYLCGYGRGPSHPLSV